MISIIHIYIVDTELLSWFLIKLQMSFTTETNIFFSFEILISRILCPKRVTQIKIIPLYQG